jgi:type II secretory pathway predicted ATPase ExeA
MSDSREAYVKWRQDRGIRIGDDPIPATEFWDAAWQAAQAQAQAVNQQLLAALQKAESHMHAMMAHIDHKPRRFQEHCWQQVLDIRAAIAAAQEQI